MFIQGGFQTEQRENCIIEFFQTAALTVCFVSAAWNND